MGIHTQTSLYVWAIFCERGACLGPGLNISREDMRMHTCHWLDDNNDDDDVTDGQADAGDDRMVMVAMMVHYVIRIPSEGEVVAAASMGGSGGLSKG